MEEQLKLNDIADELLILNKVTIDTLFRLDNCADCIALYVFYYKTAKWQKTNTIKANDMYIKKSLKWGIDKIKRTKATLKEHGLINIVQRRKDGKIEGWYIEVSYLVSQTKTEDIKIKVEESNNTQNQQVENPTSGNEETNALKEKIKCLNKEIEMLKRKKEEEKETNAVKQNSYDLIINELAMSDDEIKDSIYEFIKMRKLIKAPMTDRALKQFITKLNHLSNKKEDQLEMLNNAIISNWKTVYPLKKETSNKQNSRNYVRQEVVPDWLNKDVKETPATPEEQKELEEILKSKDQSSDFETRRAALQEKLRQKYAKKVSNS